MTWEIFAINKIKKRAVENKDSFPHGIMHCKLTCILSSGIKSAIIMEIIKIIDMFLSTFCLWLFPLIIDTERMLKGASVLPKITALPQKIAMGVNECHKFNIGIKILTLSVRQPIKKSEKNIISID